MTLPPHSTRAELVLLAGCLREPGLVLPRVWPVVAPADLYWWHHQLAYRHLLDLFAAADPGPWDLWRRLVVTGDLAEFGGFRGYCRWVADCYAADPTGAWAGVAAARVRDLAARRRAIRRAREVIRDAVAGGREPGYFEGVWRE